MNDPFFTQTNCDRCGGDLGIRRMSWFTRETLCFDCANKEDELKDRMRQAGMDPLDYEQCGYIPKV